ncbi:MAG: SAM-dependent methyltransferase, partial [Bacteroidales bacterium]|nr:SAM-dependent methyltransferase [Bacteroidales bacterium]
RKEFPKANVIARNFPISTEEVRKRAKIEDGGEVTLFFTTLNNGCRSIIICKG